MRVNEFIAQFESYDKKDRKDAIKSSLFNGLTYIEVKNTNNNIQRKQYANKR